MSCLVPTLRGDDEAQSRLEDAVMVFSEPCRPRTEGFHKTCWRKAHCIVIVPGLKKGAFIVGAKYGKGFLVSSQDGTRLVGTGRSARGRRQRRVPDRRIGTDGVLLVMNERGADRLLSSKGDVAAGPVPPAGASRLLALLNKYSATETKN